MDETRRGFRGEIHLGTWPNKMSSCPETTIISVTQGEKENEGEAKKKNGKKTNRHEAGETRWGRGGARCREGEKPRREKKRQRGRNMDAEVENWQAGSGERDGWGTALPVERKREGGDGENNERGGEPARGVTDNMDLAVTIIIMMIIIITTIILGATGCPYEKYNNSTRFLLRGRVRYPKRADKKKRREKKLPRETIDAG